MKIYFKRTHLTFSLIMGFAFLALFLSALIFKEKVQFYDSGWLILGLSNMGQYLYKKQKGYVSISNDSIRINNLWSKGIMLSEVVQLKKFAGDYTLKTAEKEITINSQIIDPESLQKLNTVLEDLNLEND